MILDFEQMEPKVLEHFYGGEQALHARMFIDENNRILRGRLEPGASIGMHTHDAGSEIIYVLSGRGTVLYDEGNEAVRAGQCHYCPKGHSHSLVNDGDQPLEFVAVVPRQ